MSLQPTLGDDDFLRPPLPPQKFLQQVGAFKEQQSFSLTSYACGQCFETLDQRVAPAADQWRRGIQGDGSEG